MTDIFQVLAYMVDKAGPLPRMKTHSLCYYAQAWHLVWEDKPLFKEEFEAWMSGPVCPELFEWHRWSYEKIGPEKLGSPAEVQMETVDKVLDFYNSSPSYWLSDLLQQEHPWMIIGTKIRPQGVVQVLIETTQFSENDAIILVNEFLENNKEKLKMWKIDSILNK